MNFMPRSIVKNQRESAAIGARIAECRRQQGMSQVELSAHLGINQNLLSAYEVGRARIGADIVARIAKALNVHPMNFSV